MLKVSLSVLKSSFHVTFAELPAGFYRRGSGNLVNEAALMAARKNKNKNRYAGNGRSGGRVIMGPDAAAA